MEIEFESNVQKSGDNLVCKKYKNSEREKNFKDPRDISGNFRKKIDNIQLEKDIEAELELLNKIDDNKYLPNEINIQKNIQNTTKRNNRYIKFP